MLGSEAATIDAGARSVKREERLERLAPEKRAFWKEYFCKQSRFRGLRSLVCFVYAGPRNLHNTS